MNYRIEKVLAFLFLLVVLLLTWYLFLIDDFVIESEERITGVFASLAMGFGIFQFWLIELNTDRRKLYDMRYETYKEFVLQIERISESMHIDMTGDEVGSIHNLLSRLDESFRQNKFHRCNEQRFSFPRAASQSGNKIDGKYCWEYPDKDK